jgi:hypothetical protein
LGKQAGEPCVEPEPQLQRVTEQWQLQWLSCQRQLQRLSIARCLAWRRRSAALKKRIASAVRERRPYPFRRSSGYAG